MRQVLRRVLIGSGLLLGGIAACGSAANAQVYGGGYYDHGRVYGEFGRDRDPRANRGGGGEIFDRVRADLDRAESNSYTSGGDRRKFNKVREELGEFQGKWANGRYDRHELDDAIGALQHVVNSSRIDYRDRDVLQDDLYRLRDFRARNEYR